MIRLTLPALLLMSACTTITDFRDRIPGAFGTGTATPVDPAPTLTAKERFVAAAEAEGCVVSVDTIAAIMTNATVSQAELGAIVAELEAEGRATVAGDSAVRIVSDNCTA